MCRLQPDKLLWRREAGKNKGQELQVFQELLA